MLLLKPFEEMTDADYTELGLKVGLEIHQQLLTEKKLFCRCPAGCYSREYDAEILRHMRPTLSELGEYDGTALMEFKTKKEIIYQINHEMVCTYEMDDTPPFEINPEALDISLEIAMLLNYNLVNEVHVARKQYLDGSIPTGFQRTTITGVDGWIPYKNRKINLIQLGLEEDACREVSDIGHLRVYRTDRLGMPLIEIVTHPEMKTPQEVAEVGNLLRWLVRSTGKVRTGAGAGREDVNVSIKGGTRVEIKGVPSFRRVPLIVYNEALRQYALLHIKEELKKRGIDQDSFEATSADVTHILKYTVWDPIARALHDENQVHCVRLKGFMGILSHPTQVGTVFAKEISDRIRVIACLSSLPNMVTSESTVETISNSRWNRVRKAIDAKPNDALILVWGSKEDVELAVKEIIDRAREATIGVPSETRQALVDDTNGFERILPGPERMYPDTDLPPLEITSEDVKRVSTQVPKQLWLRQEEYHKLGVPEHLIYKLAASPKAKLFDEIAKQNEVNPKWIVRYLCELATSWKRQGLDISKIKDDDWKNFFSLASKHHALLEKGADIFEEYIKTEEIDLESKFKEYLSPKLEHDKIGRLAQELSKNATDCSQIPHKKHRHLMRAIMKQCRGRVRGQEVNKVLWQQFETEGAL